MIPSKKRPRQGDDPIEFLKKNEKRQKRADEEKILQMKREFIQQKTFIDLPADIKGLIISIFEVKEMIKLVGYINTLNHKSRKDIVENNLLWKIIVKRLLIASGKYNIFLHDLRMEFEGFIEATKREKSEASFWKLMTEYLIRNHEQPSLTYDNINIVKDGITYMKKDASSSSVYRPMIEKTRKSHSFTHYQPRIKTVFGSYIFYLHRILVKNTKIFDDVPLGLQSNFFMGGIQVYDITKNKYIFEFEMDEDVQYLSVSDSGTLCVLTSSAPTYYDEKKELPDWNMKRNTNKEGHLIFTLHVYKDFIKNLKSLSKKETVITNIEKKFPFKLEGDFLIQTENKIGRTFHIDVFEYKRKLGTNLMYYYFNDYNFIMVYPVLIPGNNASWSKNNKPKYVLNLNFVHFINTSKWENRNVTKYIKYNLRELVSHHFSPQKLTILINPSIRIADDSYPDDDDWESRDINEFINFDTMTLLNVEYPFQVISAVRKTGKGLELKNNIWLQPYRDKEIFWTGKSKTKKNYIFHDMIPSYHFRVLGLHMTNENFDSVLMFEEEKLFGHELFIGNFQYTDISKWLVLKNLDSIVLDDITLNKLQPLRSEEGILQQTLIGNSDNYDPMNGYDLSSIGVDRFNIRVSKVESNINRLFDSGYPIIWTIKNIPLPFIQLREKKIIMNHDVKIGIDQSMEAYFDKHKNRVLHSIYSTRRNYHFRGKIYRSAYMEGIFPHDIQTAYQLISEEMVNIEELREIIEIIPDTFSHKKIWTTSGYTLLEYALWVQNKKDSSNIEYIGHFTLIFKTMSQHNLFF
jgi:hypothetical protein